MQDALGLINQHRSKGVLVDTNLLVLYLVGKVNRKRIPSFKRTQTYTVGDFDLLARLIAWFGRLVTTPHILTQASDLADLNGKELGEVRRLFQTTVDLMEERFEESRSVVRDGSFERLGLADAAISVLCRRDVLVLTDDLDLYVALLGRGVDAVNFSHVRPLHWH
jgi:hypothetical protein